MLSACKAHSAGVSRIEHAGTEPVLRWRAVAGELKGHLDTALPRTCNPGGMPLSIEGTQLISRPVRYGPIQVLHPEIEEALLVPLRANGQLLGCVWVVAHDDTRHFDAEDSESCSIDLNATDRATGAASDTMLVKGMVAIADGRL